MNRRMLRVIVAFAAASALVGCESNKTEADNNQVPASSERISSVPPAPEPYIPPPSYNPPGPASEPIINVQPTPAPRSGATVIAPGAKTYTVQKGDTLTSIARKVYGNPARFKDIAAANGISDPNKIKAGQVLTLP